MKADGFLKQVLVYRNVDEKNYYSIPFEVTLADKNLGEEAPRFEYVETVRIYPRRTEITIHDLERPIYYILPDGTRRKVYYRKRKNRSLATTARKQK